MQWLHGGFLALSFSTVPLSAGVAAEIACSDLIEYLERSAKLDGGFFDSFTFQKAGRGDLILVLFKNEPRGKVSKWKLLERYEKETTTFCVVSDGTEFGMLADLSDNSSEKRFGMPGSGQPRCSAHNDAVGSVLVRMWANRELGPSTILFVESKNRSSFQFILAEDKNWIIIETKKYRDLQACYYDRGDEYIWRSYQSN